MTGKKTEDLDFEGILYGSIIDRLAEIKEKGQFVPLGKNEEFGPEWDYIGTMSADAKALCTMLDDIQSLGKRLCKKIGTGGDDSLLLRQNDLLLERHKLVRSLFYHCLKVQVIKDLDASGIDASNIEIAFSGDYELFVRQDRGDEGHCNCPICRMGGQNEGIGVEMIISSPCELSSELAEALILSALIRRREGPETEQEDPEEKKE